MNLDDFTTGPSDYDLIEQEEIDYWDEYNESLKNSSCISMMTGESTCKHTVGSSECKKCLHYIHSSNSILGVDDDE